MNARTCFDRAATRHERRFFLAAWVAVALVLVGGVERAWAQVPFNRSDKPRVRARPPAAWDKTTSSAFLPDAFDTLEGQRPDFGAVASKPATATLPQTGEAPSIAVSPGGFKWSAVVSPDTLADEIKEMKGVVKKAVASVSDFKGGGYNDAREAFTSIALAFAVTAAYDGEVRWKKEAETARDLFARVGNNCKVGTQQSFDESKARVADLEALIDGSPINTKSEREEGEDFAWSQAAGRPPLMKRLEVADEITSAAVASKEDFTKQAEKLLHEVELVAVIGEVIQRPDYEYHDDETYRGYAAQMRDAALQVREAVQKSDYNAARTAVGELKKSCDTCHGDYRS